MLHTYILDHIRHLVKESISTHVDQNRDVFADHQARVCGCLSDQLQTCLQLVQSRAVGSTGPCGTTSHLSGGTSLYQSLVHTRLIILCCVQRHYLAESTRMYVNNNWEYPICHSLACIIQYVYRCTTHREWYDTIQCSMNQTSAYSFDS